MQSEKPNPYTQDSQVAGPDKKIARTPFRRAVRTMVTTIAIMGAVFIVLSAVIFIEAMIKREPVEDFWATLRDEPLIPLLFLTTLPVLASNRKNNDCCCISRLLRKKNSARRSPASTSMAQPAEPKE